MYKKFSNEFMCELLELALLCAENDSDSLNITIPHKDRDDVKLNVEINFSTVTDTE